LEPYSYEDKNFFQVVLFSPDSPEGECVKKKRKKENESEYSRLFVVKEPTSSGPIDWIRICVGEGRIAKVNESEEDDEKRVNETFFYK